MAARGLQAGQNDPAKQVAAYYAGNPNLLSSPWCYYREDLFYNLQTQTLFTVAQDLREMQIKISVDEADIGKIKEHQDVVYTVSVLWTARPRTRSWPPWSA